MNKLVRTFMDLAVIDEVYGQEDKTLGYIEARLRAAKTRFQRDQAGNIVATIKGKSEDALGLCAHVDIAAPLLGRKVIIEDNQIRTDGVALLGGDDKTAVAAFLELADYLHQNSIVPSRTLQLVFTIGEEAGLLGAKALDDDMLEARQILVFDWYGTVGNVVSESPAYYEVDVKYLGKDAHPALWQTGVNAGQVLMRAAAELRQGDYSKDVIFNIGIVNIGHARNKVPGHAALQAELRSYSDAAAKKAAAEVAAHFRGYATKAGITPTIDVSLSSGSFRLDKSGGLFRDISNVLKAQRIPCRIGPTYGCFDGNIFAQRGKEVVTMGAAFYEPHSPSEYVDIAQFDQMYDFIRAFCCR